MDEPRGVDFVASEPHFLDHLAPIAREARSRGLRTRFFIKEDAESAVERHPDLDFTLAKPRSASDGNLITVCASIGDANNAVNHRKRVVLCEHGAGQSYSDRNPSYVGGEGRERFAGVLVPNIAAAERHRRFYRRGPGVEVVGSPRVDDLISTYAGKKRHTPPMVAVSWHWECRAVPETESAFPEIGEGVLSELRRLERLGWIKLMGHQHPRATLPRPAYERHDIWFVDSFDAVCLNADIYMVDNSSTLFEFAALGRPVIVMNSPHYRRRADHGLRFWSASSIGPNVWRQRDVAYAVAAAIEDGPARQAERLAGVQAAYTTIGGAAGRAMDAIEMFDQKGRHA